MRYVPLLLILASTVLMNAACGQERVEPRPGAESTAPADAASAQQADRSWMAALEHGDTAAISDFLDQEFQWTDAQGHTRSKTESMETLASLAAALRDETDRQAYHYGRVHVITSAQPDARTMRVWALRPDGWRLFNVIRTRLTTGGTPFAATGPAGDADCDNPCRSMPFSPATDNEKTIAAIFQQLKVDEWRPDPDNWAPYVLDDVYYVTATAQLSKADRVEHLRKLRESGAPSVPGDPVVSMRIHDFGDSAVMIARHTPYRGGQPYHSVRVWALRDGRWQLANTQQTVIADAAPAPPVRGTG